jgi:hypothetical protein
MQPIEPGNQEKKILLLFAVGTFGLNLFILLLLFFHGAMLQQLTQQLTPQSLVEMLDGRVILANPEISTDRQPETIRRFVGETMTLMLSSSPKQSFTEIWQNSSSLFDSRSSQKFVAEFTKFNKSEQLGGIKNNENVLIIERISQPVAISTGKWKVKIIANQLTFNSSNFLGKSTPFNKQVLVQAIASQTMILPNNPLPLQLAINKLGESRLKIYNICPLNEQKCS